MAFCECITQLDELLKEYNTELVLSFNIFDQTLPPQIPIIATQKVDTKKRGKPKSVLATFCPFCGEKLKKEEITEESNAN